jgi:hypothetical protein
VLDLGYLVVLVIVLVAIALLAGRLGYRVYRSHR